MTISELEEYYATRSKWYYSKNLIENYSPSRRDGISKELEAKTRSEYCHFIRGLWHDLKLYILAKKERETGIVMNRNVIPTARDMISTASAIMFCHRFFMHQSLAKNDPTTIGAACVLLASKSEDAQHKLMNVVKIVFKDDIEKNTDKAMQKTVRKKKRELLELAERLVLKTIRFELNVNHAFRPLHDAMKSLKIYDKNIRKEAWGLIDTWMHTSLVLQHEPEYIAAGSLRIATRGHDFDLPDNWWQNFDIIPDSLSVCLGEMVEILFIKRPRLAEQLANRVSLRPIMDSQPIRLTPVLVLQSTGTIGSAKMDVFASETSSSEKKTETKQKEVKGKGKDPLNIGQNVKLKISSSREEVCKQRKIEAGKEDDLSVKIDVAKIRETVIKRKMNREKSGVKGEVSSDDDWMEKELESGIIMESKNQNNKTSKTEVKIDIPKIKALRKRKMNTEIGSAKLDVTGDDWIEKEIESGIVVGPKVDKKRSKTVEKEEKKLQH